MNKSRIQPKPLLAWMQPEASRQQQLLSVALVPSQPGLKEHISLLEQILAQQAGKVITILRKAKEQEPAARSDLMSRMSSLGLLQMEAQDDSLRDAEMVSILMGNPELELHLPIQTRFFEEIEEIPGARELLEEMTLYQWMEALENQVNGKL